MALQYYDDDDNDDGDDDYSESDNDDGINATWVHYAQNISLPTSNLSWFSQFRLTCELVSSLGAFLFIMYLYHF